MTPEELKTAVAEALDDKLGKFFIEREQHFLDHNFTKGVREGIGTARKASIYVVASAAVGFVFWAITEWVTQIKGGG